MPWEFRKTVLRLSARSGRLCPVFVHFQGTNKKEDARMRKFRQYAATTLIVAMVGTNMSIPALADVSEDTGGGKKRMVPGR